MKRSLLPILCCPVCKGDLTLRVTLEDEKEIIEGVLQCPACGVDYPIEEGIPDLLPREKSKKT
ncbi:MAG TPA: methytransferase partner Trm112 [Methanolinea sp.]|nr:methytransferase partner Trm112 [Methanolinea sp.]HQE86377.1 methytransferase partner Trm112 [Methanolinea sp.]